jgi:hypothetical protein
MNSIWRPNAEQGVQNSGPFLSERKFCSVEVRQTTLLEIMPFLPNSEFSTLKFISGIPVPIFTALSIEIYQLYSLKQTWSPFNSTLDLKLSSPFQNRYSGDIDMLLDYISAVRLPEYNPLLFESDLGITSF